MFETIITLITVVLWAVAIFLFGGGVLLCIGNLIKGKGWEKFWAIIAIIAGVIAFYYLYTWLSSIVWCLMLTGIVVALISDLGSNKLQPAPQKEKEPGVIEAIADQYIKDQRDIAVVEEAIRRSRK